MISCSRCQRETVGIPVERIMEASYCSGGLHLQLLFRGLQIVGQRFHINMGATSHDSVGASDDRVIHMAISRMEITE